MQRAANTHVDIVELAVMMRSEDGEAVWRGHPVPESVGWLGYMSCGSVLTALGLTKHGPTIVSSLTYTSVELMRTPVAHLLSLLENCFLFISLYSGFH